MWHALAWRRHDDPEIAATIEALRQDTLRLLLATATVGYLAWHYVNLWLAVGAPHPDDQIARTWLLFPPAGLSLAIGIFLVRRQARYTAEWFLASSAVVTSLAVGVLRAPAATMFCPLLVLASVVLLHQVAGIVIGVGSLSLLFGLERLGQLPFLTNGRLLETAAVSAVTLVVAWALRRNTVIAVEWSLHSYARAVQQTRMAQDHRAQLVRALKQLDAAYYHLERANASLALAWKAAETAERSRSEFVTNISHELRTPLNLIVGFSELILTSPETYGAELPAAFRGDLNAIYRSAQHLLTLCNDVIDLARVGVGRLSLALEPVDLGQVIPNACDIIREYLGAKNLWLRIDVTSDLPVLSLDRLRVRQVLLNLLTNAARFTEHGGVTVSASRDDDSVLVQVADTGRGMSQEALTQIFDEFYQAEPHRETSPGDLGGAGLGLTISKSFVELHGGQMGARSTIGIGTTFWFTLPLSHNGADVLPPRRSLDIIHATRPGERVLILASADRWLAQFLQHHLRGCRVMAEPDLQQAVRTAVEYRALALLADADAEQPTTWDDLPVPLFRLPLPSRRRRAAGLGVAAFLVKPVTRAELHAAIGALGQTVRRILVVDDDPRFARLLERLLAPRGPNVLAYDIITAHNGQEALSRMEASAPDLVLLDLALPDLDGQCVVAAMAAAPALAQIPVIVISAQDQIDHESSLSPYLSVTKPQGFRIEEVLGAVESLLSVLDPPRAYLTEPAAAHV